MADFTERQVRTWVAQEAAKHTTPESRTARIAKERQALEAAALLGLDRQLPNSAKAHRLLIETLTAAKGGASC